MDFVYVIVDVFVDGRRAASGDGTYVRVTADATCKQLLMQFLQTYASEYCPLPDSTVVNMWCVKLGESFQTRPVCDVGGNIDVAKPEAERQPRCRGCCTLRSGATFCSGK